MAERVGHLRWRIGGALITLVVGALADKVGTNRLFVMLALFDLIGAAILWVLLRGDTLAQPAKAG